MRFLRETLMHRTILAALAVTGALCTAAFAADLPRRAPAAAIYNPAPVYNWSGFNVELYGDMANLNSHGSEDFFGILTVDHNASAMKPRFGAKVGYDWQIDRLVVGPRLGYTFGKIETSTTDAFGLTHTEAVKSQLELTGHLGWDMGQFQPYAELGAAFGSVEHCASVGGFFSECWSNKKVAPTASLGMLMRFTENVYGDLAFNGTWYGSTDYTDTTTGITGSADATVYSVRAGLGVRF